MMKAVVISEFGNADVLQVQEREVPNLSEYEVLVKVRAAGINRPDLFQRQGKYPAPNGVSQDIPGLEVAGIVGDHRGKVSGFNCGQRGMALVPGDRKSVGEGKRGNVGGRGEIEQDKIEH